MNKETRQAIRELAFYSSLGFSIVLAIFLGLFAGIYLDKKFDTLPWLTLIGLGFGIAAAYKNIALAIKKSQSL
jgi:ATP synthase protein I